MKPSTPNRPLNPMAWLIGASLLAFAFIAESRAENITPVAWIAAAILTRSIYKQYRRRATRERIILNNLQFTGAILALRLTLLIDPRILTPSNDPAQLEAINQLLNAICTFSVCLYIQKSAVLFRWKAKRLKPNQRKALMKSSALLMIAIAALFVELITHQELPCTNFHPLHLTAHQALLYLAATLYTASAVVIDTTRRCNKKTQLRFLKTVILAALLWVAVTAKMQWQITTLDQMPVLLGYMILTLMAGCAILYKISDVKILSPLTRFSFVSRIHLLMVYLVVSTILCCAAISIFTWSELIQKDQWSALSQAELEPLERLINLFMVVLVAAYLISILLYRLLTRQIETLTQAITAAGVMKPIEKNNKIRMDIQLKELIQKYNKMVGYLHESYRVVAQYERESLWQEMAQRMAHEIKNPLTPMKLKVQMLQREDAHDCATRYQIKSAQTLSMILKQIDIIDEAVDEFRDFARSHKSDPKTLNLVSIVMGVAMVYDDFKGVRVKVINRKGMPHWIKADENQISRLIANLCKNAVEASANQTKGVVELILDRDYLDNSIVIVKDSGKGIPLEQRSHIFEPNFTTKAEGNGIGLSISKEIVERWGGTIAYENRPAGGTIFRVAFPSTLG